MHPNRAVISAAAIRRNTVALRARTSAELLAVVKAGGCGHGAGPAARAAAAGGASRIGIAQVSEAVALLEAGELPDIPVFAWMFSPRCDLGAALACGIELSAGAPWALEAISQAAARAAVRARVHLAVDTGMAREGIEPERWAAFVRQALRTPHIEVVGAWSHLARADEPGEPSGTTARQTALFNRALQEAALAGAEFEMVHLAASGGLLFHPETHYSMVRVGLALYGLMPDGSEPESYGLEPAMRLEAELIGVRTVPAGTPVSYGGITRVGPTRLGTVPLGYSDGIPRHASLGATPTAWVAVRGRRAPVVGRVCMDQFVVDLGPDSTEEAGETVVVWGAGGGTPTVDDWARAAGTINYAIIAGVGRRVPRVWTE